jgi:hypothetical protein
MEQLQTSEPHSVVPSTQPEPRTSAALTGFHREGGFIFGVVAKRTYQVRSGSCYEASDQVPLVEAPRYGAEDALLERDTDLVLQRQEVDIIVQGHAYSPGPSSFRAGIFVGDFRRELAVFGDRRLDRSGGALRFTPPASCEAVPLTWQNAYGGVDHEARRLIGDPWAEALEAEGLMADPRFGLYAYPRNPLGKGYLIEPTDEAIDACRLPNIEEPYQLLTSETVVRGDFMRWPTGPVVAATGWLSHNYFPRMCQLGLPPAPYNDAEVRASDFIEVQAGLVRPDTVRHQTTIRDRVDPRAAQGAAVGMRAHQVVPKARVELHNLHPNEPSWRFRLPCKAPRMLYQLAGGAAEMLEPKIRTVLIEPDADRVTLVWVGEQRIDLPLSPDQLSEVRHGVLWQ